MNKLTVVFVCCIAMCVLGFAQNNFCGTNPMIKQNTCSNSIGGVACLVCLVSIYLILKK